MVVVGVRPNLPKVAPLYRALKALKVDTALVDTGQHYDNALYASSYKDLKLPPPDFTLAIGVGDPAVQTARVMERLHGVYQEHRPRMTVVVGDVNSTLGAALASHQMGVPVAHLEAGIRSFDSSMPEEVNRIIVDRISTLLLAPTDTACMNLASERVEGTYVLVGNTMIDSLERHRKDAEKRTPWRTFGYAPDGYGVVTLHRPSLVDHPARLKACMKTLSNAAERHGLPFVFPAHPRTRKALQTMGEFPGVSVCEPMGYLDFLSLLMRSRLVVTDSGGIQEETSILGIPCITYRSTTERPETCAYGTNVVSGVKPVRLAGLIDMEMKMRDTVRQPADIPLWDGQAAERAAGAIQRAVRR